LAAATAVEAAIRRSRSMRRMRWRMRTADFGAGEGRGAAAMVGETTFLG
jgi:hypothetical protein